jgi:hypothetical protein
MSKRNAGNQEEMLTRNDRVSTVKETHSVPNQRI